MIITIALAATVAAILGFGVALTVRSKRDFADANEVVPGVPSIAPASWAGAHTPEAKLHRRLRAAVLAARSIPRLDELGLAEQRRAIESEALAIDEQLVAASGLADRHRDLAIPVIDTSVAALEDAVAALTQTTTIGDSKQLLDQVTSDAYIKLQALAAARAEVEAIDRGTPGTATG